MNKKKIADCLANNLRTLRKKQELTQEALAEKAGVSAQSIHYIESQSRWPSPEMISALAAALHVSEAELFEDPQSVTSLERAWEIVSSEMESSLLKKKTKPKTPPGK